MFKLTANDFDLFKVLYLLGLLDTLFLEGDLTGVFSVLIWLVLCLNSSRLLTYLFFNEKGDSLLLIVTIFFFYITDETNPLEIDYICFALSPTPIDFFEVAAVGYK